MNAVVSTGNRNFSSNKILVQPQPMQHRSMTFKRHLGRKMVAMLGMSLMLILGTVLQVTGQATCAFDQKMAELIATDPAAAATIRQNEQHIRDYIAQHPVSRPNGTLTAYTIPVVFHVMHTGGAVGTIYNPSDAVLQAYVTYLNQVFAGTYSGMLAPVEGGGVVNMELTFALAQRTPSCAATNGIDRVNLSGNAAYVAGGVNRSGSTGISDVDLKNLSRWNPSDYYNIWIVNKIDAADGTIGQFIAGYAYFAGAPANLDGTVMLATQAVAGQSTLPHEIGHAFNLYHTFEGSNLNTSCPANTNCATQGDLVCDTDPITNNVNASGIYSFACRTGTNTCTGTAYTRNTEENFMGYTNCNNLFTNGQKARVQAAMLLPSRLSLGNSLGATPCGTVINFVQASDAKTESTSGTTLLCRKYVDYTYQMNIGSAPSATAVATLTFSGTATKGVDYDVTTNGNFSAPSNNITFPSGATAVQSFTVRVYDDAAVETAESIILNFTLNNGGGNASIGTSTPALTIAINDNDVAPAVSFSATQVVGTLTYNLVQAAGDPLLNSKLQSKRTQLLYKASELTSAGLVAGNLTAVAFYVGAKNSTRAFGNLTIKMGGTTNSSLYTGSALQLLSGLTTVKNAHTYSTVLGYNNFALDVPFAWNGTDNIVVEVCYDNGTADAGQVSDNVFGYSDCGASCATGNMVWQDGINCATSFSSVTFFNNNVKPTIRFTQTNSGSPTAVSTALNSTRSAYLGPNDDVYFYDASGNVLARIKNNTAFDYGCTDVTIDRAGTGAAQFWNSTTANYLASKSIRVVPTNNTSSGNYQLTLYYSPTEVTGWQTATGQTWANSRIVKVSNGFYVPDVTAAAPHASDVTVVTPSPAPGLFGTNYAVTGTFSNTGFSGFGVGVPGTANVITPLTINSGAIASNNANPALARTGNIITLSFVTSAAPALTPVVTIAGTSATVTGSGTTWSAAITVAGGTSQGIVSFSISVQDAASNITNRTTTTDASSVTIDNTAPTIPTAIIASNNASSTSLARTGNVVTVTFTTSEAPAATPTATIAGTSATVSGSGTNWTAAITVAGGTTQGVAAISISVQDAAGNTASRTTTTNASSVTIDNTAPTIPTATIASNNASSTSLARTGNVVTVTFTTSEAPAATPTATIAGTSATVSGSGTNWTAAITVAGGTTPGVAAISISVQDAAGNTASRTTTTNASSVTIDNTAPTIPTATIASNNASSASLARTGNVVTVTFTTSEAPAATPTATIAGTSATVSGSGTNWTAAITVAGGTTPGVAAISISVQDAAGNTASRTTTTNASSVTIDNTAPTIPTATIASNNASSASLARTGNVVTVTFTTSEAPAATPTATIAGTSATVSGSGTNWTAAITVAGGTTQGVAAISISVQDAAGNTASRTTTTNASSVTIDNTAPTIPTATIASNNASSASLARTGNVVTVTFTTSEAPAATPTATIAGTSATVSGSGTNWTAAITVSGGTTQGVAAISISVQDAAGNTTSRTTTTNASSVTIDNTAPTIPTATIASNNASSASLARTGNIITVTFTTSEAPAATPTATIAGTSATVSGSGTNWTAAITVAGGTTQGVAAISISVQDAAGNTASRTTTTNASSVTIDNTAPTIPTATIASNNASSASLAGTGNVVTVTFTTSETPAATPTVTIAGTSATVSGSGTNWTAAITVAGGTTQGVAAISISVQDAAGNTASRTTTTNASSVTIDNTAPTIPTATIASSNASSASLARTGDVVTVTFTTSEALAATPTATIAGTSATVSGSGTNWTATITVAGGTTQGVAAISISVQDAAGNTASRTTTTNASSVTIDNTAPTIPTATIASNNASSASLARTGDVVTVTFTTSEALAATPTATIAGTSATVSGSGTNWTAAITVAGGTTQGVAAISISVQDAAGNTASRTTTTNASSVTIDNTAPTIPTATIASNNASSASLARTGNIITVTFTTSETPAATPTATIAGTSATVSGSGTNWTAAITVAGGTTQGVAAISISVQDAAGNTASRTTTTNASSVTIDNTAPTIPTATIASNNASSASLARTGDVVTVTFTTSEALAATPTATIAGTSATVSGSGTNWTAAITVAGGTTQGVAAISISVQDAAGNTASRTTTTNASSVTIDNTAPTIPTATIASNNASSASLARTGDVVTVTFTTSETLAATPTATIAGTSATVSGSGSNWTAAITVTGGTTQGVAAISISVQDAAGNTASITTTTNASSVTIDNTAPTIPTATIASSNASSASLARTGDVVTVTFTTSEALAATPTATIAGTSATVSGSGTNWTATITVAGGTTQGVAAISISVQDAAGNTASRTTTTNASSVTIDNSAPFLTAVSISSNNGSPTLANAGNVVTISFTSSEAIVNPAVTIAGSAANVSGGPLNWTASRTIVCNDQNGNASFAITSYNDLAGNPGTSVTATTNASAVNIATGVTAAITNNTGVTQLTCTTTSINVTATGGSSYSWTGGTSPNSATNSFTTAGTYIVTVSGAGACTATAQIIITSNTTAPAAAITNNSGTTVISCGGSISVTATGGGSYAWSGGLGNSASATITNAGTYTVTVTGANGCTSTASITTTLGTGSNTFTGTGNWTDNLRWSCGTPPVSGDAIIIAAGANCTLNVDFTLTGSLTALPTSTFTVAAGRTLTIAGSANFNGQRVVFQSNANGSASLGQVTGVINGATNVTVERYIPNNGFRSWRLLSVPTFGSQTIRDAWQEGNAPLQNNAPGYGTQIAAAGSVPAVQAAGFDNASTQTSIQRYNGTSWVNLTSTLTPISAEKAYFMFVRGDRTQGVIGATTQTTATTLRTNGNIYTGNQASGNIPANTFQVLGNPYISAIDFTSLNRTGGVKNTFYVWDAKKQSGSSLGTYQTFSGINNFNCLLAGGSYVVGAPNTKIEGGQAFFVETGAANGSVTFTEASKISGNGSLGFRPATPTSSLVKIDTRLYTGTTATANQADANVVVFDDAFSSTVDGDDALKLSNPGENLAIQRDNQVLAVEGRPLFASRDTVQYKIWNLRQQTYRLEFIASNMPGLTAILEDKFLNSRRLIDLFTTSSVSFTTTADPASRAVDRFRLVFGHAAPLASHFISVSANRGSVGVQANWKVSADRNISKYQVERSADGRRFNNVATVSAVNNASSQSYEFIDLSAPAGTLYYRIMSVGQAGEVNYSSIVKIASEASKQGYAIAPNPVEGATVNLQFNNQPAGTYQVNILSILGQTLSCRQAKHSGGNSTQVLDLPGNLASGSYQLEIIAPDQSRSVQSLIVNRQ